MVAQKHTASQRDFSVGQVDTSLKRSEDNPVFKLSARQCVNFRITNTKKLTNRIGRTALFVDGPRVDEVLMSPGNTFYLVFGAGVLKVRNAAGAVVFSTTHKGDGSTPIPWTATTCKNVTWDVYQLQIFIAYADGAPNNVPQVLTWDGISQTSTWTLTTFAELITAGGQKQTFFDRISPQNVVMTPTGLSGAISLVFSSPIAVPGMVGTRFRWIGRQVLVTGFQSTTILLATVEEVPLLGSQSMTFAGPADGAFNVGDVVIGSVSGAEGIVTATAGDAMTVQLLKPILFTIQASTPPGDDIVGPGGASGALAVSSFQTPAGVSVWDDEVMNTFRGFPSSVTVDQSRLVFMNFPSVPSGIGYSAIGNLTDLYVPFTGVVADNAIFDIAPNKSQILYMVPGMESSEFIFCDNAIYYFPITISQPLSGTSGIAFNKMTSDGCGPVQPRLIQEALVFVPAGQSTVRAITATGAFLRPYEVRPLSELHDTLLNTPIAIAGPTATDPNFPERYFYVLNSDGTIAQAKISVKDGQLLEPPGWMVMSGVGNVGWVSSRQGGSGVLFVTTYAPGSAAPVTITEKNDGTQFLDAALFYNNVPAALAPPSGQGPLWWLANGTCTVLDLGTRQLGLYQISSTGFLIPQFEGGENLSSTQLVVGQAWTAIFEPWLAGAEPGSDLMQRMTQRAVGMMAIAYENSTGFVWQKLYSGRQGPKLPALGTVVLERRVTTYNQDDDPTQPPILREDVDFFRPPGREYDPRTAIVKDTAGPFTIIEFASEATV